MYQEISFPGHGLLPLTCVSIESWWTGCMHALQGMGSNTREMDRTDCTSAESHSGCCTSVQKTGKEWVYSVWARLTRKEDGWQ